MCCDPLVGLINMLCGDGDCDALRADDYTFSASSLGILAHDLHGVATSLWHSDLGCGNGGSGDWYGCHCVESGNRAVTLLSRPRAVFLLEYFETGQVMNTRVFMVNTI